MRAFLNVKMDLWHFEKPHFLSKIYNSRFAAKFVRRTFDAITSNEALLALQLVGLCKTPTEVLNRVVK